MRDRIRLRSQSGPLAPAWLKVVPNAEVHTDLGDTEFQLLAKFWLGLPILPPPGGEPLKCPECSKPVDKYGDHLVSCHKLGLMARHHALRDVLHAFCEKHRIPVAKEVPVPALPPKDGEPAPRIRQPVRVPADILLIGWDKGRDVAVDFVITHPLAAHLQPHNLDQASRHLKRAEDEKVGGPRGQGVMCKAVGWGFAPAAFSPWGAMGANACALLYELSRRATSNLFGWRRAEKVREFYENVSITIMRRVAISLQAKNRVQAEAAAGRD